MVLQLNGEQHETAAGTTMTQLLESLGLGERRVAIEYNGNVLTKERWATTELQTDDKIEIVHFVGGG